MNFKLELPEGTILVKRSDLRIALQELLIEVQGENSRRDEVMTIRDAAEYLKVSVPTIRNMISKREIPYFQRGQVIRFNRWEVKEWLQNNSKS